MESERISVLCLALAMLWVLENMHIRDNDGAVGKTQQLSFPSQAQKSLGEIAMQSPEVTCNYVLAGLTGRGMCAQPPCPRRVMK